ncbi:MAG: DUF423 domain-containing protein [Kangiellaceae bacterium]|nr:DUF423 domain-containing protein [Kangiellaceae bacterium]
MSKKFILHGSMFMALAVALGAMGSHILEKKLSTSALHLFELGVRYQIYHAIGLLAIGLIAKQFANRKTLWAGWLMFFGIIGFSGGLYFYALTEQVYFRHIIPVGGCLLIVSWLCLAWSVLSHKNES